MTLRCACGLCKPPTTHARPHISHRVAVSRVTDSLRAHLSRAVCARAHQRQLDYTRYNDAREACVLIQSLCSHGLSRRHSAGARAHGACATRQHTAPHTSGIHSTYQPRSTARAAVLDSQREKTHLGRAANSQARHLHRHSRMRSQIIPRSARTQRLSVCRCTRHPLSQHPHYPRRPAHIQPPWLRRGARRRMQPPASGPIGKCEGDLSATTGALGHCLLCNVCATTPQPLEALLARTATLYSSSLHPARSATRTPVSHSASPFEVQPAPSHASKSGRTRKPPPKPPWPPERWPV